MIAIWTNAILPDRKTNFKNKRKKFNFEPSIVSEFKNFKETAEIRQWFRLKQKVCNDKRLQINKIA